MKNYIFIITLIGVSTIGFSQEEENYFLEADSTWFKEIIKFPISFARDINFEGFEELRFPANWAKEHSNEFWSYIWVWNITNKENLTAAEIEKNIEFYFNGLMDLGPNSSNKTEPKTTAIFIKKGTNNKISEFIGKVKTFDSRFTKKPITFNVSVEQFYCITEKKIVSVFRLSPKPFDTAVWLTLKSVTLRNTICED